MNSRRIGRFHFRAGFHDVMLQLNANVDVKSALYYVGAFVKSTFYENIQIDFEKQEKAGLSEESL